MKTALRPHLPIYLALLGLLTLTAICAWVPMGFVHLPLSLAIGSAKTALVMIFFMKLKQEPTLMRLAALVGIFWLSIFLMLVLTDYLSRFPGYLFR